MRIFHGFSTISTYDLQTHDFLEVQIKYIVKNTYRKNWNLRQMVPAAFSQFLILQKRFLGTILAFGKKDNEIQNRFDVKCPTLHFNTGNTNFGSRIS